MSSQITNILLIEANKNHVFLLKALMTQAHKLPMSIEHVERLSEGIALLAQGEIDVVILDLSLPDSEGLDTFKQIYAHFPEVPIIILSEIADEEIAAVAVQSGAQDYLVKGQFNGDLLLKTIRYSIERHSLHLSLKQQAKFLQVREQQLHRLIAKNTDGMLIVNDEGLIVFANPAAESLFGCKAGELQEVPLGYPLVVGESTEIEIVYKFRETITVEMRVAEVEWDSQIAYLASLRDISLRKQVEVALKQMNHVLETRVSERTAQLEQANQDLQKMQVRLSQALTQEQELSTFKSRIISRISHEYRTPLTTIALSAEMLSEYRHQWDDSRQLKHFGQIQSMIQRLTALVDDALMINQAESGELELKLEPINLVGFCRELISELQGQIRTPHQLLFSSRNVNSEASIIGKFDAKLLRQIISNLLSNAIKYSPQGGTVQFRLICEVDTAIFQVQDEGIGIPPQDQEKLFEAFYRGSNINEIGGTGLGLAITKKCVEVHNGQIEVESALGVGTTVLVKFPLEGELAVANNTKSSL
ncbi:MAG: response regulator [Symploca sp. SIO1C4]|uniref:histidine kinase n=1 Tax=Symploca sp. SIO1C4 TaxID=2607765 RepID=A0A6B3N1S6_9CYAN|nr:response regulator [Symploca sp. SIO1C4]